MHELVVISGKGGTGKTSLTASFAILSGRAVVADCDVDAADLHLLLAPHVLERHEFWSGKGAAIDHALCSPCGVCVEACRFDAIHEEGGDAAGTAVRVRIDPFACEGCGACVARCPTGALSLVDRRCGEWMVSETRCGPMVHARLAPAAENSGKLVSVVRREARRVAGLVGRPQVIVDGPPGIGCPVIASLTGASLVLVVTEPTVSGEHDLARVLALSRHFAMPAAVCVNKWDINPEMAARIEDGARQAGAAIAGRVRYDTAVTRAQLDGLTPVETDSPVAEDVHRLWASLGSAVTGAVDHGIAIRFQRGGARRSDDAAPAVTPGQK